MYSSNIKQTHGHSIATEKAFPDEGDHGKNLKEQYSICLSYAVGSQIGVTREFKNFLATKFPNLAGP